jgi:hypothetical protein
MNMAGPANDGEAVLTGETTQGLGEIRFLQPPGTFALTPASRTAFPATTSSDARAV